MAMEVEGKRYEPGLKDLGDRGDSAHQTDVEAKLIRKSLVDAKGYARDDREEYDDDGHVKRMGTYWTASSHIITAVIGSGVLSLAWAIMYLGWVAGPILLIIFAIITWHYSVMLVDAYRYPSVDGPTRNYTYIEAVDRYLGRPYMVCCGLVQYINMFGTGIGYTVTGGIAIVAIQHGDCLQRYPNYDPSDPNATDPCLTSNWPMMILFGAVQLLLSQIQDFDRLWWLSVLAAVMSFTYSFIGLGLSIAGTAQWQTHSTGTADGIETDVADKWWNIMVALGSIAFAYSYSYILLEMTDTVKFPENKPMRKAIGTSVAITTFFYITIGVFGYAAFGNPNTPGNLLSGGGFTYPLWLIDLANAAIFVHLLGAYQVWTQPLFGFVEERIFKMFPDALWMQKDLASFHIPGLGLFRLNVFRLIWRSLYVAITTLLAALLPFFNDIVGLLGSLGFWPLTIFFPTQIYMVQNSIQRWSMRWWILQTISMFCLLVSIAAAAGSVRGIIVDAQTYQPFQSVTG